MHRICSLCVEKNARIAERSKYSDIGSSTKYIVLWLEEIVVSVIADICYNLVENQLFPYFMMHFLEKHVVCHLIGGEWYRKTRAYINNGTSN